MSLYREDKEEVREICKEEIGQAKEGTKQITIVLMAVIIIFTMFFMTIMHCSNEKTKRLQIEKFGEEIRIEE